MTMGKDEAAEKLDRAIDDVRSVFDGYDPRCDFQRGWIQGWCDRILSDLESLANEIEKQ